ncbi:MAG TPA: DUF1287 domain-containing protein [Xanthomonadales bacterium]|nr:DUF1287 domain-containing protein [Xanthomonadales bacterium]
MKLVLLALLLLVATPSFADDATALVAAARARTRLHEVYDGAYRTIAYPGGDVPSDRGVCTDLVIRSYRALGIDLQVFVHEDMRAHFDAYPKTWGLRRPDRNIDHRRVPNLQAFLVRSGASVAVTRDAGDYDAGDLVTWLLPGNLPHIGIVSDRRMSGGTRPLVLHNIGAGPVEDDILFAYPITGHYRWFPARDGAAQPR